MGLLDIILGLLLAYGLYRGLKNGLFVEVASVIALIAGLFGAIHFSYLTADFLGQYVEWEARYLKIAAFIVTFMAIVIGVHMLGKALTRLADFAMIGFLNTLAGGVFGVLKVAIILGALLVFFERANNSLGWVQSSYAAESIFYEPLKETGALVFGWVLEPENTAD